MPTLTEAEVEAVLREHLGRLGYACLIDAVSGPDGRSPEGEAYSDTILAGRLRHSVARLALLAISREGDWTGWCGFFLRAIIEQAGTNQSKAQAIHTLYTARKDWMVEATRSQYGVRALDWIFGRPPAAGARQWPAARDQTLERQAARRTGLPRASEHLRRAGRVLRITCSAQTGLWITSGENPRHNVVCFEQVIDKPVTRPW